VYAIQDQGSPIVASLRSSLVQQTAIAATDGSGNENIKTPYPTVNLTVNDGWFIDLPNVGERALSTPELVGGMLMFSTVIPQQQPCNGGCGGFIYAVNQFNGDGGLNFLVDTTNHASYDAIATLVGCVKGLTLITSTSTLEWYASGNGVNLNSGGTGTGTAGAGGIGGPGNTGVGITTAGGPSSASIQHGAGNLINSGRISWHEQIINQ
jgi:Tfp pilus tip-associated adhesin PilY1